MPATAKPGIWIVMNLAPISVPNEEPTVVPAELNADIVARMSSGTRSDSVAITGASIMFKPNMQTQ